MKRQRLAFNGTIRYRNCSHILGTSNICERFFSKTKFALRDNRKLLSNFTFEMIMMLNVNDDLWNAVTVLKCLQKSSLDDPVPDIPVEYQDLVYDDDGDSGNDSDEENILDAL